MINFQRVLCWIVRYIIAMTFTKKTTRTISAAAVSITAAATLGLTAIAPAAAAPTLPWPAPVTGGPTDLPDRQVSRTTADGWVLHAAKTDESVNIAPPLDASATTGEAFGTLTGNVWIDGNGAPELTGAMFDAGYQIGCGVDISSGVDVELAGTAGIAPHADAGIEGGPSVQVDLPSVTGVSAGADATARAEAGVDGKIEASPTVQAHLNPGGVSDISLVSMPVDPDYKRASAGFTGAHLQINGCAGPVSIRSYVTVSTTSPTSVDAVSVYGKATRIR
ncbi:Putative secreted protein [Corynebacterium glyciniphilum AJ 3170]|uniref:Putative secreted protein n=2 Tax=Corynebacterium TaxID=1716 RepID=X5E788_9CORY|nr:Putative secreted protein [Corynebacterium glyciniphilum AJ 3170]